jgi:hypothetical protein
VQHEASKVLAERVLRGDLSGSSNEVEQDMARAVLDLCNELAEVRRERDRFVDQQQRILDSTHATIRLLPDEQKSALAISCRTAQCRCWCGMHAGSVMDGR